MVEAHSSPIRLRAPTQRRGIGRSPPANAMLDALHIPAAVVAKAGDVLAANGAWLAEWSAGENYLERLNSHLFADAAAADGIARVFRGERKCWDEVCRKSGGGEVVRVRVRSIWHAGADCFVVTHEAVDDLVDDDDLEDRVLAAQIQERERLASELHDSVGQNLVCLGLGLGRLRRLAATEGELATVVGDMAESLQQAQTQIRTLSFLLQPPWLDRPGGFEGGLRDLVTGFVRRAGLQASVEVEREACDLTRGRQLALFRILQEALVNIHRHARADAVEVRLFRRARHIVLKVRDNGRGMPAPEGVAPTPGVGIISMRARLRRFGGDLRIVTGQDGTTVVAKLPTPST